MPPGILENKIDFEQFIRSLLHSQSLVCFLCPFILFLGVQTQSANILPALCFPFNELKQCLENPLPPVFLQYVNALNPPERPVPPIAPLIGDHKLSDDPPPSFRHV